jgi:hypothetical protein
MDTVQNILPFRYVITVPVSASGTAEAQVTMSSDSFFEHWNTFVTTSEDDPNDSRPNNVTVKLADQATGRDLSNGDVPQVSFLPQSNQPAGVRPTAFLPSTTINVRVVNLTASALTTYVVLEGYKLFNP